MQEKPELKNGTGTSSRVASNSTLSENSHIKGSVVKADGHRWFRIDGIEKMSPFLMTMASDADHWLFLLSNGGLTAGRKDPDHALFPYYTQDKLSDMAPHIGSRTIIRIAQEDGKEVCWEPFSSTGRQNPDISRYLLKNELGNCIILGEKNAALNLEVRVKWRPSDRFGFVRKMELVNNGKADATIHILDGFQNILPSFVSQRFQNEFSILGDAYKKNELLKPANIGIYHLSSVPTDLALPMEALRANVVWQTGLDSEVYLLSDTQTNAFREGKECTNESSTRGRRGSFYSCNTLTAKAGTPLEWYTCGDIDKDAADVEELSDTLSETTNLAEEIEKDCQLTEQNLRKMLANADGFQCSADERRTMRHTSNTLFNLMRGGALTTGYQLPVRDIIQTVAKFNKEAATKLREILKDRKTLDCSDPWEAAGELEAAGKDAVRLLREYLPLSFSRRHGDPSRPWNRFSIEIKEPDGSPRFYYQGNWRDIFQNWEALLQSYPEYLEASICRFINSSTADGYNPYRLTKDGFEWEELEPGDAWANIGYWGDHQIIYLLRLLESSKRFNPERLTNLLQEEACVYAEIPYRIRTYREILDNPRTTIDYDDDWAERIEKRFKAKGSDGKLMHDADGQILYVNMLEKLITPLLAKLSNFIPGGGIWMNTQRPEWNDANNALVGFGISVVTLGYVHRYLEFLEKELGPAIAGEDASISTEVIELLESQLTVFSKDPVITDPAERYRFMESLNLPASEFRQNLYDNGLSGRKGNLAGERILEFVKAARKHVKQCLLENRRDDHLWHSYNLLDLGAGKVSIKNLTAMLEGQVSVLSSGILGGDQTLRLIEAMRKSPLYREDQQSYILYPNKELPDFLGKNLIPKSAVEGNKLLSSMAKAGDPSIIRPRKSGDYAFNSKFHNSQDLAEAFEALKENPSYSGINESDVASALKIFENAFNHHSFTGRSGTFFAYEGLGSIYWHMVSKMVLAVQEIVMETEADSDTRKKLIQAYVELRDGLGVHKTPDHYGAIPTDAYSHTPAHAGAQQPGMTGQVKEDILIRQAEMGIRVENGCLGFDTRMLPRDEVLKEADTMISVTSENELAFIKLEAGTIGLSFCSIPVIYRIGNAAKANIRIKMAGKDPQTIDGLTLPENLSREIFKRSGAVRELEINLP